MPGAHRRDLLVLAGLMILGPGGRPASAQEGAAAAAPLPALALPGTVAEVGLAPAPPLAPAGPEFGPPGAQDASPSPGGCTCGDRRGLSRWRWHRKQCKRHLQEHFLGYAEEFNEWPLGSSAYAHARAQIGNGQAARMVFNHYDFVDGSSQLNTRGRDKLAAVAATLPTHFFPIVVERTPKEPGLDESRKAVLLAELARGSFPVPSERVLIGPSIAHGMSGFESLLLYGRQVQNLATGGAIGAAGSQGFVGGGLGFDPGGLSGSAVGGLGGLGGLGR
jgi:hypothetical protein